MAALRENLRPLSKTLTKSETRAMTTSPSLPKYPIGFPLLTAPDADGNWAWPSLDQSIRDSLRAILMTRAGEWVLHRARGVGLVDYLQRPNTSDTRTTLADRITKEVSLLEKRIVLIRVEVAPTGARENEITITLRYRVRRTGVISTQAINLILGGGAS